MESKTTKFAGKGSGEHTELSSGKKGKISDNVIFSESWLFPDVIVRQKLIAAMPFSKIEYYAYGVSSSKASRPDILKHEVLVIRLIGMDENVIGSPLQIHLVHLDGDMYAIKLEDSRWEPPDPQPQFFPYSKGENAKWLIEEIKKLAQVISTKEYEVIGNNCQQVVTDIVEGLFPGNPVFYGVNTPYAKEGASLACTTTLSAALFSVMFVFLGVFMVLLFPSFAIRKPESNGSIVPCYADNFSTCTFGYPQCEWPDMDSCHITLRYSYEGVYYSERFDINRMTVGGRVCYPGGMLSWLFPNICCGLPKENSTAELFCQLNVSGTEVAIDSLPSLFIYTFDNVNMKVLPLPFLVIFPMVLFLVCYIIFFGLPMSNFIGSHCPNCICDRAQNDQERKYVTDVVSDWGIIIGCFYLFTMLTLVVFFYGRLSGTNLALVGFAFFALSCLVSIPIVKGCFRCAHHDNMTRCNATIFLELVVYCVHVYACIIIGAATWATPCETPLGFMIILFGLVSFVYVQKRARDELKVKVSFPWPVFVLHGILAFPTIAFLALLPQSFKCSKTLWSASVAMVVWGLLSFLLAAFGLSYECYRVSRKRGSYDIVS